MRKRRGSQQERHERAPIRNEPNGASPGPSILWIDGFVQWAREVPASEWQGPSPEMIEAALCMAERAAARAKAGKR